MTSAQIKEAMLNFWPVRYNGITFMQCELLDQNQRSVVIAESEKVELIENG